VWTWATRAEALLGLGELNAAAHALRRFVESPDIKAFQVGSTLRQFEEVWELGRGGDDARDLLVLLRARLSEMESGTVRLAPGEARDLQDGQALNRLEAVFGAGRFTSLNWFKLALERCGCVAKIGTDTVSGVGTGWLVRGGDLVESLGDEVLLVTNEHVISETCPKAVAPDDVVVRFQASSCIDPAAALLIQPKLVFSSPANALDVTVARFASPLPEATGLRLARQVPLPQEGARVLVIGHPEGGDLAFSINDNALLDRDERYLHYRAPTEGGSSGSPVFNMDWKVVGLHHGGGQALPQLNGKTGTYQANEGIRVDAITAAMRAAL
jgi:S1-C subfamily serine protease